MTMPRSMADKSLYERVLEQTIDHHLDTLQFVMIILMRKLMPTGDVC
jgi:hypothetical protein